jgi:peptidoglycan L-alanyl-D-glutamate endopeptidase CwlK
MSFSLGTKSREKLNGVHPDLVSVVERAIGITKKDFTVLEGLRSKERQAQLFAAGKSKTMNSRHITGHAVDLGPWPLNGDFDSDGILNIADWDEYYPLADAMKQAAKELGVAIVWGGDWKGFPDGPHFELDRKVYPA